MSSSEYSAAAFLLVAVAASVLLIRWLERRDTKS